MTIQMIPLSKLRLSPHNVRKTGAEVGLDELVANIEANGVLSNLIGGPAKKKGFFDIFAGGRRLRALNILARESTIAKDHSVPVLVLEQSAECAAETSLAENFIRLRMTPTDECKAFQHFLGTDGDIDAVAKRFGQTRRFVEGRLRLATLADPIFDTLAAGEMTMEVAKAYAATPDQAKQLAVFEDVKGSWLATNVHEIRKRILGASIPASHPVALLVGEERYTQAGGRVVRDLFTVSEEAEWLDGDIATGIAAGLLQDAAAAHAEASGIGTVVPLLATSSSWSDREELTHARLERAPLSNEATTRLAAIQAEYAEIEAECEATEMDEVSINASNARIEALEREEAELQATALQIADDQKAGLTQFVVIGPDGTPTVEATYWEPLRRHGSDGSTSTKYVDPRKAAAKKQGLNGVLTDELAMARRDVLALHVAYDPGIALDLAIFALAERALGKSYGLGMSLMVGPRGDPIVKGAVAPSTAGGALAEIRKGLDTDWAEHTTTAERFDAFRALPDDLRASWLAVCTASALEASLGGSGLDRHNPFHDHLGQLLDINVADWWRPSAGGYFSRVRKAGMQKALSDIGGPVLAAKYANAKSAEMADACEKLCAGGAITEPELREAALAWLPLVMRFDPPTASEDEPESDADKEAAADALMTDDELDDNASAEVDADAHQESELDAPAGEGQENAGAPAPLPDIFASYAALKADAGDAVLLYHMGDFYEVFGPDAAVVASLLDLALTKRKIGKIAADMIGIPVHAAEAQIALLIATGMSVAIAERCEAEGADAAHGIIRVVSADAQAPLDAPEEALAA